METPDFKKIAAQLRNPSGEDGLGTADRMEENNAGMIRACIDQLSLNDGNSVLEIGFGGGGHLLYLLGLAQGLRYQGVDISETMTKRAKEVNRDAVAAGRATFQTVLPQNGSVTFPFEADTFDCIFTVNTIYFWDNALVQAQEIGRVLKPGAVFIVAFATEEFMKDLPFTQYGFHLYSIAKARTLMEEAGFIIKGVTEKTETVMSNGWPLMERTFILLSVSKKPQ